MYISKATAQIIETKINEFLKSEDKISNCYTYNNLKEFKEVTIGRFYEKGRKTRVSAYFKLSKYSTLRIYDIIRCEDTGYVLFIEERSRKNKDFCPRSHISFEINKE